MSEYLLLCSATRLSVTPTADLWLSGIRAEQPYLRGLLDKLGVEPDFMTNGEYKSAAEMFMRTGPSKEADEMNNWMLDSIYNSWINQIDARDVLSAFDPPDGVPAAGKRATAALGFARSMMGVPYKWGGETPEGGFDCSGLVQWAYAKAGISLPRVTRAVPRTITQCSSR